MDLQIGEANRKFSTHGGDGTAAAAPIRADVITTGVKISSVPGGNTIRISENIETKSQLSGRATENEGAEPEVMDSPVNTQPDGANVQTENDAADEVTEPEVVASPVNAQPDNVENNGPINADEAYCIAPWKVYDRILDAFVGDDGFTHGDTNKLPQLAEKLNEERAAFNNALSNLPEGISKHQSVSKVGNLIALEKELHSIKTISVVMKSLISGLPSLPNGAEDLAAAARRVYHAKMELLSEQEYFRIISSLHDLHAFMEACRRAEMGLLI
ncbi:MAG: hypothetical protein LBT64_02520 [Puniceicoccales bacterium]|jgi:hypothetical protein|nr:hypothetical protein [Puniceicoccales bacterium]